jgi:hypothetical protein
MKTSEIKKPCGYVYLEEKYPELENHAKVLSKMICDNIKAIVYSGYLKSKCPYPAQCILEMTIKKLEKAV